MEDFDDVKLEDTGESPAIKTPSFFKMMFAKMTGDMRFVGLFTIIYGAISCISIIGALIGIPLIIAGLRLREAADQFDMFKATNNPASMRMGFELQGKYFNIQKILIIIALVLAGISIIFMIFSFSIIFSSLSDYSRV
jgi:hypothetical protein